MDRYSASMPISWIMPTALVAPTLHPESLAHRSHLPFLVAPTRSTYLQLTNMDASSERPTMAGGTIHGNQHMMEGFHNSLLANGNTMEWPFIQRPPLGGEYVPRTCHALLFTTFLTFPSSRGQLDDGLTNQHMCVSVTNTPEWKPQSCSPIPVPIPFNSTLSHVATAQPTNNGFSYVVHYVGLSIKGELLYSQQYTDNNGLDFFTQDNLSGSLTFVGEPLVSYLLLYSTYRG